jgi:hypothetical protein
MDILVTRTGFMNSPAKRSFFFRTGRMTTFSSVSLNSSGILMNLLISLPETTVEYIFIGFTSFEAYIASLLYFFIIKKTAAILLTESALMEPSSQKFGGHNAN